MESRTWTSTSTTASMRRLGDTTLLRSRAALFCRSNFPSGLTCKTIRLTHTRRTISLISCCRTSSEALQTPIQPEPTSLRSPKRRWWPLKRSPRRKDPSRRGQRRSLLRMSHLKTWRRQRKSSLRIKKIKTSSQAQETVSRKRIPLTSR